MKEKQDIHEAKLITSYQLSPEEIEDFKNKIKNLLCTPQGTLNFSYQVDSNLLGGYQMVLDGSVVDRSFLTHQNSWERLMTDRKSRRESFYSSIPKFLY